MSRIRRVLVVAGLAVAVALGAALPAWAAFNDTAVVSTKIPTVTVQAPTGLTVEDHCVTTTTTTKRTVRTDPVTRVQTQTAWSRTITYADSSTNVDSTTQSSTAGPGTDETTTTTVDKNTDLHVTLRWTGSPTREVTGYLVSAHLGIDGSVAPMLRTTGTQVSAVQDADALYYRPSLLVTTETRYGWTADSARTTALTC
ncbi:hypothetical protein [Blastococcus xanthinilyticus]|uniref:Fibronectin type-III domain-containing protein n=1 Tax=Blastococcus xanthinilyticus TaxID=1564164 RepID=A0A5S5CP95_9ACTN|nr:hypothetical protein [Blastococcus xanthinilyticus]TYP82795.1 hypothetical protein BD833_11831 [Blastococcus xanthinilyticus]